MKSLYLSFITISFSFIANAQVSFSRVIPFLTDFGDQVHQITLFNDEYYVLANLGNNEYEYTGFMKLDLNLTPLTTQTYENTPSPIPMDPGPSYNLVITNESIYMAGSIPTAPGEFKLCLLQTNQEGLLIDTAIQYDIYDDYSESAVKLRLSQNNTLVMLARRTEEGSNLRSDILILETDLSGNLLDTHIIESDTQYYYAKDLHQLADGTWLLAAFSCIPGGGCVGIEQYGIVMKLDANFEVLWQKELPVSSTFAPNVSLAPLQNGNMAVSWMRDTIVFGGTHFQWPPAVYLLDSMGNQIGVTPFDTAADKNIVYMSTLSNGDILGFGTTNEFPDFSTEGGWVFRLNPQGQLLWERKIMDYRYNLKFGGLGWFYDATETPEGDILLAGLIDNEVAQSSDMWFVQLTADGCFDNQDCQEDLILITTNEDLNIENNYPLFFPNPVSEYIQLKLPKEWSKAGIKIINMSGKTVYQAIHHQQDKISLSFLAKGVYTLQAFSDNQKRIIVNKLIK